MVDQDSTTFKPEQFEANLREIIEDIFKEKVNRTVTEMTDLCTMALIHSRDVESTVGIIRGLFLDAENNFLAENGQTEGVILPISREARDHVIFKSLERALQETKGITEV